MESKFMCEAMLRKIQTLRMMVMDMEEAPSAKRLRKLFRGG